MALSTSIKIVGYSAQHVITAVGIYFFKEMRDQDLFVNKYQ